MFLHIAKTQKMGHVVQEKPGQISRPADWNCNDLSPFKEPDLLHTASSCVHFSKWAKPWNSPAVSWQPEVTDLQWADKGCIEVSASPIHPPSTYPVQHRQTHMVSNTWFLLQTNVSCSTSTPPQLQTTTAALGIQEAVTQLWGVCDTTQTSISWSWDLCNPEIERISS